MAITTYKQWRDEQQRLIDEERTAAADTAEKKRQLTETAAADARSSAISQADTQRDMSYQAATARLNRELTSADDTFERSRATYGQLAEQLAQGGLTGSGFSDNMTRDAYAARASAVSAANTRHGDAVQNADMVHGESVKTAETTYRGLMNKAALGEETEKATAESDARGKYSELADAELEYARKEAATKKELALTSGDTEAYISAGVDVGEFTAEEGKKKLYEHYESALADGSIDTQKVQISYENKAISGPQYEDIKQKWNDRIDVSADSFRDASSGALMTKSSAKRVIDSIIKDPLCDPGTRDALEAMFEDLYTPIVKGENNSADIDELEEVDNNFSVKVGDEKYEVESGGECTDANVKEVAADVAENAMFGYDHKIYIKKEGRVFELSPRENAYPGHWRALQEIFFGSGDVSALRGDPDVNRYAAKRIGTGS